jgi:DDE superfamily endonuclease
MDVGIIRSFKARYRKKLVRWLLDAVHANLKRKLNMLEAVRFAITSWNEVPKEVIQRCWAHCGIVDGVTIALNAQDTDYRKPIDSETENELAMLMQGMEGMSSVVGVDEYVEADSDEQIECLSDVIERGDDDAEASSSDSETEAIKVHPSVAIECCLTHHSLLSIRIVKKKCPVSTKSQNSSESSAFKAVDITTFFQPSST